MNESKSAIVVPVNKTSCTQGRTLGSFRIVGYDTRNLELEAGEQRRFTTICYIGEKLNGGPYSINFRDISARNADGSSGKILTTNLSLNLVPAAKN